MNNIVKGDTLIIDDAVKSGVIMKAKEIIKQANLPRNSSYFEDYWFMYKTPKGKYYDVNIYENCAEDGLKLAVYDTVFNGEYYSTIGNEWCLIGYIKHL